MTAAELKVLVGVYGLVEANKKLLKFDADLKALASSDPTVTLHAEVDIAGFAEFEALKAAASDPVTTTLRAQIDDLGFEEAAIKKAIFEDPAAAVLRAEIDETGFAEAATRKDMFEESVTTHLRAESSGFDTVIAQLDAIRMMVERPIVQEVKLEIDKSSLATLGAAAAEETAAASAAGDPFAAGFGMAKRAGRFYVNGPEYRSGPGPVKRESQQQITEDMVGLRQWTNSHETFWSSTGPPGGKGAATAAATGAAGSSEADAFWSNLLGGAIGGRDGGGGGGIASSILWGGGGHLPGWGGMRATPWLAGPLSLGAMAGFGAEHVLFTGLGLAGSAAGAMLGGGLIGAGALGTMAVGGGSDLAVMKSTITATKELGTRYDALQQAVALYGAHSKQAAKAAAELDLAMREAGPAGKAELHVAKQGEALGEFWKNATADARVQASHILSQVMGLGHAYVPLVAHAADQNLAIIDKDLKPLMSWLKGPEGTGIFEHLEEVFAHNLPTAMDALEQGVQFFAKTINVASNYTGGFIESVDDFFTKWNEPQNFQKWEGEIGHLVGDFHLWLNLIKQLGVDVFDLFSQDAHTGNTIVQTLDGMLVKLHEWETSTTGKQELHNLFVVHKQEIVELLHLIPLFVSAIEPVYMTVAPFLTEAMTGVLGDLGEFLKLLDETGPVTRFGLGLGLIAGKLVGFKTLFGMLGKQLWAPFKSMLAQAPLIGGMFTEEESATDKLTAATGGLTEAVDKLTASYEAMGAAASQSMSVLSAEESAQADINTMLYSYGPYAGTIAAEKKYGPGAVPSYFGVEGGAPGTIGGKALGALGKGAMVGLPVWIGSQMLGTAIGGHAGHTISNIGTFAGAGAGLGAAVGSFFPEFGGPITGGLLGGGIGAAVGGITELLHETKHLTAMQKALAASSHLVDQRMSESAHGYAVVEQAQARLVGAERHAHQTAGALHKAEANLEDVRRQFGPTSEPAIKAEQELLLKRHDNAKAVKAVERAESAHGVVKQMEEKSIAESVASLRVQIGTMREKQQAVNEEWQSGNRSQEVAQKGIYWNEKLQKAQGQLGEEMQKAAALGKPFAERLSQEGQAAAHFGEHAIVLRHQINALDEGMIELKAHGADRFGLGMDELRSKSHTAETALHEFFHQTKSGWVELSEAAIKHNEATGESLRSLAEASGETFQLIAKNTESMTGVFGGKVPHFHIEMPSRTGGAVMGHQRGGHIDIGAPSGDSVPVIVERGEYILNRNAVAAVGVNHLNALNYGAHARFQKGGQVGGLGPEPHLEGPTGALEELGRRAIHAVYSGAEHYLHTHGGGAGGSGPVGYVPGGGGPVAAQMWNVLRAHGYNQIGAAGVIGNAGQESALNPGSIGSGGGGLLGFTTSPISLADLQAFAKAQKKPWTDVGLQMQFFLMHEAGIRAGVNSQPDAAAAAAYFMNNWEHPEVAVENQAHREEVARWAFARGYTEGGMVGQAERERGVPSEAGYGKGSGRSRYEGAGYVFPFSHAHVNWGRIDEGVDFTGTGPIQAIGTGVVTRIMPDWYKNQSLIDYKLTEGPKRGQYIYVAEGINSNLSVGQQVTAGEQIATFAHGTENDSIETGWGSAGGNGTLANGGSGPTAAGQSFYGFLKQLQSGQGWHGTGTSAFQKQEEKFGGIFHGAHTKSLNFPSIPSNLHGVVSLIDTWRGKLQTYEHAVHLATGRPELQRALQANVTAIQKYLRELERARHKLRTEAARKKYTSHLAHQLGKVTGEEKNIEIAQRAYEVANQEAEQIVGLEPREPILKQVPAGAPEAQVLEIEKANHALEEKHLHEYEAYVGGVEHPAYAKVLGAEAEWRKVILGAEAKATGMETGWENQVRTRAAEIAGFEAYDREVAKHLKDWQGSHKKGEAMPSWLKDQLAERKRLEAEIPGIRDQERELRKVLGEARQEFYGGFQTGTSKGAVRVVQPPQPPMAGSGTFEQQALQEVQGIHWPGQHEYLATLPATRQEGMFGGAIWSTQTAIEELGLSVQQAQAGLGSIAGGGPGGGSTTPGESERTQLLEELLTQANQEKAIDEIARQTLSGAHVIPFAGAYADGGTVAALVGEQGPEIITTRPGAYIHTASETRGLMNPSVRVHIHGDINSDRDDPVAVFLNDERFPAAVEQVTGRGDRRDSRSVRRGRARPGF